MTPQSLRRIAAIAMAVGTVATTGTAQVSDAPLPPTKTGQLMGEWLRLCRSSTLEQMTAWLSHNLSAGGASRGSAADRAVNQQAVCVPNGGFRLTAVNKSEPNTIDVRVVGLKSGTWFTMTLLADTSGRIDRVGLGPTIPPESVMPRDLSDAALATDVRQLVARVSQAGLFSGIVVVARDTQVIATASGGYANRAKRTPVTPSTQFTLGSMGKMFTAASIGQLVDRGRMSFDDTVGKFFPTYPNQTVREKVTVGMLLSHKAGMGDFLRERTPHMMKDGVRRAAEFMPLYDSTPPQFPPGTSWAYSNAGLALAGAIVEQVSGEDYPDYLKQHVFAPAGMANSDPNNVPHVTDQLVTPYTQQTDSGQPGPWHEAEHDVGSPAGGAISTARDLIQFAAALRGGRLVRATTFDAMTKPRQIFPTGDSYGYAMEIRDVYGRTAVGHGGGFPGVNTHLYLVLGSPYTVVVLANQDPPAEAYASMTVLAWVGEKAKRGE